MTLQLEEGRFYKTRAGEKVGPMRCLGGVNTWNWLVVGDVHRAWGQDGERNPGARMPETDLVALWDDEPASAAQPVTKTSLLEAATAAVADRGLNYGKPEANFDRIARLWQAHLINRYGPGPMSFVLDGADVAQMMVLMKIARLENSPAHLDSWTDIAGYAACGAELTNAP